MKNTTFTQSGIDEVEGIVTTILEFANGTTNRIDIIRLFCKNRKVEIERYIKQYYTSEPMKYEDGYNYAISQLPEDERGQWDIKPIEYKKVTFSTKETPKTGQWNQCSKCNGTGLYVMWTENGKAMSTTGTTCYKCNGKGWTPKKTK